jgi:t-SNARE complex subunit (syntaxin)
MRNRWVVNLGATLLAGMLGSTLLAPAASGQKREVLELQQIVNQLIQNFQFLQAQVIQDHAVQKTLLEQALDSVNRLSSTMGGLQKTVRTCRQTPAPGWIRCPRRIRVSPTICRS